MNTIYAIRIPGLLIHLATLLPKWEDVSCLYLSTNASYMVPFLSVSSTYDHRVWRTGLPVRSAVLKPHAGHTLQPLQTVYPECSGHHSFASEYPRNSADNQGSNRHS
ncbi:hypothetical protein N7540_000275 [Penicillium herquei]|nr:hypothetical protein N7540_000275 [Penicillium herquei]